MEVGKLGSLKVLIRAQNKTIAQRMIVMLLA